jgi:GT2 family glycosyltransferase
MTAADVSVVVPTIGRSELLDACLRSIHACDPAPGEILVVDQSGDPAVAAVVERFTEGRARLVPCDALGIGRATNLGLESARHRTALVTHDDCTVAPDWVGVGCELAGNDAQAIFTGRVLPAGDPRAVPSWTDDPLPRDYTQERHFGALFPNNMVCNRHEILGFGGFDERLPFAAEDNDLCYRWLRAGRTLRYDPRLVVWHHDWRTHEELERLYVRYWRGQGAFYAKHLRHGDVRLVRALARDLRSGVQSVLSGAARGRPRWQDSRRGILQGLVPGLLTGWGDFERGRGPRA